MSIKNQKKNPESDIPVQDDKPSLSRNQLFKEDEFQFSDPSLETRLLKICGDNKTNLLLFKKAIFWTETCKDESNHHEWNTSLKGHNYTTGKFDIELNCHLNKDVPDISALSPGRYRLIIKYYNPYKRRKNKIFGCVDTQSIDFTVGQIGEPVQSRGSLQGAKQESPAGLQNLALLDTIGQTVGKVGEILNKSMEIHQSTIMYSDKIKTEAYNEGYERRKQEEEKERQIKELTERLDRLEKNPVPATQNAGGLQDMLIPLLKKIGLLPDIDLAGITPEALTEILTKMKPGTGEDKK